MAVMALDIGGTAIKSALYNEGTLTEDRKSVV